MEILEQPFCFFPDVALYLEGTGKSRIGTLIRQSTGIKTYLNGDACKLALTVAEYRPISEFASAYRGDQYESVLASCQKILETLSGARFIEPGHRRATKVRNIRVDPPLRVLFVETTKRCNLQCRHCYVEDSGRPRQKEMGESKLLDIIAQADAMGVMEVQLTGGEITTVPFADTLITTLQDRLINCSVFTNGMVLPYRVREVLRKNHHGLIFYVSLDGFQEQHDWLRSKVGAFTATVRFIEELLGLGCDVRINTAVGRHNIDIVRTLQEYVAQRFGVMHRFVSLEMTGRAIEADNLLVSSKEFAKLWSDKANSMPFLDSHDALSASEWEAPACGVAGSMMFINAYGEASLCPTMTRMQSERFVAGSILNTSLAKLWNSSTYTRFRGIQCKNIRKCPARELCRGGCRSKAFLDTGDLTAPDREMCALYERTAR